VLASSNFAPGKSTELSHLLAGYRLCAKSEGKSKNTIDIVASSINYLANYLYSEGLPTDVLEITHTEIRAFILYLQRKRCFSHHPYSRPQDRPLSSHTVHCYLRSIRAFWSWLVEEEIVDENPFHRVKLPKVISKITPTFSPEQLHCLVSVIDTSTPEGYRDYTIIITLLDSALRVSELTGIRLDDVMLDDGLIRVMGKGGRERCVPVGAEVRRALWRYIARCRPHVLTPDAAYLFLTREGERLTRNRVGAILQRYGRRAGITGVRVSPHTLRHTAAVSFLRNGGDVFSLQRLLGHSSLEMTRHYCQLADVDVKRSHQTASPVDNMKLSTKFTKNGVKQCQVLTSSDNRNLGSL
jgi:site-specific recombinase XerD